LEAFSPIGDGTYDLATYTSTFNSTLSANTTSCEASATWTNYHNTLLSDGVTDPTATTIANHFCEKRARADAIAAAHNAADASSATKWITLQAYGTGARPKIAPGGSVKFALRFGVGGTFGGGWKIQDVDFANAQDAGIDAEVLGVNPATRQAHGLWIKNSKFTNIAGMVPNYAFPSTDDHLYGYTPLFACSIATTHVNQAVFENVESDTSDCPLWVFGGDGVWVKGGNFHDSGRNGAVFDGIGNTGPGGSISGATTITPVSNLLFDTTTVSNSGAGAGSTKGVAGINASNDRDVIIQNSTFTLTHANAADGVGIDFEGWDTNGNPEVSGLYLVQGNTFSSNQNAAFLCNQQAGQTMTSDSELLLDSNILTSNASNSLPAILAMRTGIANDNFIFTRNNVTLATSTQNKWSGNSTQTYTPLTNTTPTGYTFGASNNVHFP